jgi:hypothetical protein
MKKPIAKTSISRQGGLWRDYDYLLAGWQPALAREGGGLAFLRRRIALRFAWIAQGQSRYLDRGIQVRFRFFQDFKNPLVDQVRFIAASSLPGEGAHRLSPKAWSTG